MSSKDKNLSDIDISTIGDCSDFKIAIVTSDWNQEITSALENGAQELLLSCQVKKDNIYTSRVPGAFELPFGAKLMLQKFQPDAVICIGCVIQGETKHNNYINHTVARSISSLGLMSNTPIIYGVLTPNDKQQAEERSGGKHGNKGHEAAYTALKMAKLKKSLAEKEKGIGF